MEGIKIKPIQVLIMQEIQNKKVTAKELAQKTGVRYETARNHLLELEKNKKIQRIGQKLVFQKRWKNM